jgi:hypothetical protein
MRTIVILMLLSTHILAECDSSNNCYIKATKALSACEVLEIDEAAQIAHLQTAIKSLEDKVVEEDRPPLLPWWQVAILGVAAGFVVGAKVGK